MIVKDLIKEVEALNITMTEFSTDVKEKFLTCPSQWVQITKNFIKKIDDDISLRKCLANELHEAAISTNILRMVDITYKLGELDHTDKIACKMYSAKMNEWD